MIEFVIYLLKDERGDSEIIDTSIALIFILGLFIGFVIYSNSARERVIMNYSAKEGARMYAISKEASEGVGTAYTYLGIGNVISATVSPVGTSGINIKNDLPIYIPFFDSENLKLVSEFIFFEEFDPKYYEMGEEGFGWLKTPYVTTREYKDDSEIR